ncbi:ATP-binding cassette domain-containing protein [Micromonospora sp. NPDC049044]|uniref:ATP-binding cassette domain-containing protein n=1 Tax=unclassified Micromonospora TaxID=2617518 RepID=UPI0033C7BE08
MIRAEKLARAYGDTQAVAGVDLSVDGGEIFAFLGPNGAGKTTTVRMLVTLLRPTGGSASVAGFDVVKQADQVRRRIGVTLQELSLDPTMTAADLLRLHLALHGLTRDRAAAARGAELLDEFGLGTVVKKPVLAYSIGMRRRLDLALALVHRPQVLFLDEPTTGLDPASRQAIWQRVRQLRAEGAAVFLTTQYIEEADQLADRVSIIDSGEIVVEGSPERLKATAGNSRLELVTEGPLPATLGQSLESLALLRSTGDGTATVELDKDEADIAAIIRVFEQAGVTVRGMQVHRPSLEDVFLAHTGRQLEGTHQPAAMKAVTRG